MPWLTPDNPPSTEYVYRRIRIPNTFRLPGAVDGALLPLTFTYNWEQFGDMTPDEAASIMREIVLETINEDSWSVLGVIIPYCSAQAPTHTLPCDGAIYLRADYPRLYAVLDDAFKVDSDQFKTPDLIGRFPFGATLAPASDYPVGTIFGDERVALTVSELPSHNHSVTGHVHTTGNSLTGVALTPGELPVLLPNPVPATTSIGFEGINNTGSNEAHNNMPPGMAVRWAVYYE